MRWMVRLRLRLRSLLFWRQVDQELDDELRYHVDRLIDGFATAGMSAQDARQAAMREMGALEPQKEACRDARGQLFVEAWMRDLALAVRSLRRVPGFTFAAVASLACGVALVAVTLSLVNAYLIRSMPYPDADRLYHVTYVAVGQPEPRGLATLDWAALSDVVEIADNSSGTRFYLTDGSYTQEAQGMLVAAGSVGSLGVSAVIGRTLDARDYQPGSERVALVGQGLWRDRFGADPSVVGREFRASIGNQSRPPETFRIVGVLPPGFRYVRNYARAEMAIAVPLQSPAQTYMVRLRRGVPPTAAEQRITDAVAQLPSASTARAPIRVRLASVHEQYISDVRPILRAVGTGAALILVIVVANVAILTLLRTLRRQKEIAVRLALGAANRHIVRLLVAEACIVTGAALGGALGVTTLALGWLAPRIEAQLGRPVPGGTSALALDPTVLLMLGVIGVAVALSLSAVPLLTPWQRQLADQLRRDARTGTDGPTIRWARSGLIAVEIAGTLALLVGCGLMVRTVLNIVRTDLGMDTRNVVRTRLALPALTYSDGPTLLRFYERFADQVTTRARADVGLTNFPVLAEAPKQALDADGVEGKLAVGVRSVSPGYFAALGIPISQGRAFTAADRIGSEPVAIVSQSLARQLWSGTNAMGRRLRTGEQPVANAPPGAWRTVVGVVGDVRQGFQDHDQSDVFLPFYQAPNQFAPLVVRTEVPPSQWTEILRTTVGEIDAGVQVGTVTSLQAEADQQTAGPRFLASLLTGFAALAASIALLGIYGVTAYAVQQRAREVAIRMALGANRKGVVRLFMRDTSLVLAVGLLLGLIGSTVVAKAIQHQLFGVPLLDGLTVGVTSVLLAVGGLLATWWPALRATQQSPSAILGAQ
jgi:predicted permease